MTTRLDLLLGKHARQWRGATAVTLFIAQQRRIVTGIQVFFRNYGPRSSIKTKGEAGESACHAFFVIVRQKEVAEARARCKGYNCRDRARGTSQRKMSARALVHDVNDEADNSDRNE